MLNYFSNKFSVVGVFVLLSLMACGGSSNKDKSTHLLAGSVQGSSLKLKGEVSSVNGLFVSKDGVGELATFANPSAIASDGVYLYVADSYSHVIRKIVVETGAVTTIAGKSGEEGNTDGVGSAARFSYPSGLTTDGTYLYIVDVRNRAIRKLTLASGEVSTMPLSGDIYTIDGNYGGGLILNFSIAHDANNLYVNDFFGNVIRKIVIATGEVGILAGTVSELGGAVDGTGSAASFFRPAAMVSDGVYLYVCDSGYGLIRKILLATGEVSTVFGGSHNGSYLDVFAQPSGIAIKGDNLFVTDIFTDAIYQLNISTGERSWLAGSAGSNAQDYDGIGTDFYRPSAIVNYGDDFYVADSGNNKIRKLTLATGAVTTTAGSKAYVDVEHITTDGANLYTVRSDLIYKTVIATGQTTDLIQFESGIGLRGFYASPLITGITTDGVNLYVADTGFNIIRKVVLTTGVATILAGASSLDGMSADTNFSNLEGITTDGVNLYVLDGGSVRKVTIATGVVTTLLDGEGLEGGVYGAGLNFPPFAGITTDGANLYVADSRGHTIRKIVIATKKITTLAGRNDVEGSEDGIGSAASFNAPAAIATDGTNLYITDSDSHLIRKLVIATGKVITVAGKANSSGANDGLGGAATFHNPTGIATDGKALYVVDERNYSIRKIE